MASPTLFLKTDVPGVFRIPGRCWSGDPMNPTSLGVSGPWGYLVVQKSLAAVLVDVPYFSDALAKEVQQQAPRGISHLFLSHDDFVDSQVLASWKKALPDLVRVAHSSDCNPNSMETALKGAGPWEIAGLRIDHMPGHSAGSVFFSSSELSAVFTGDSIAYWGGEATGFGFRCHFGQNEQAASLRKFASSAPFCKALFPGHGSPAFFQDDDERRRFFEQAARGLE